MNDNSHSFGLFLGEFLDKAAIAMSEIATAAEDFINKTVENSIELQHPADTKRMEILTNFPNDFSTNKQPSSHTKQNKKTSSLKIKKAETEIANKVTKIVEKNKKDEDRKILFSSESDESSTEILATQTTGKAAGFSTKHYLINEAEDSNDAEEEEEENDSDAYSSTSYSDVNI